MRVTCAAELGGKTTDIVFWVAVRYDFTIPSIGHTLPHPPLKIFVHTIPHKAVTGSLLITVSIYPIQVHRTVLHYTDHGLDRHIRLGNPSEEYLVSVAKSGRT